VFRNRLYAQERSAALEKRVDAVAHQAKMTEDHFWELDKNVSYFSDRGDEDFANLEYRVKRLEDALAEQIEGIQLPLHPLAEGAEPERRRKSYRNVPLDMNYLRELDRGK
jgi:hypothetical protein